MDDELAAIAKHVQDIGKQLHGVAQADDRAPPATLANALQGATDHLVETLGIAELTGDEEQEDDTGQDQQQQ